MSKDKENKCCNGNCSHDEPHHEEYHEQHHEHHKHNDNEHHHNCGCNHHHEAESHECGCNHHHEAESHECGCGHHHEDNNHGCGCGHEHHQNSNADIIRYIISALTFVTSFFVTDIMYLSPILKTASAIICGYKILWRGIKSLIKLKFDENTLMAIAAVSASVMGDFNESYLIVILFSIGEHMEEYAINKSHKRIETLINITDEYTYDESGNKISAKTLKKGDTFLVHPGDKICTDAVIIKGTTSFDTSGITGESMPVEKSKGDGVLSGYINTGNAVVCSAATDYADSTVSKIKQYVINANQKKAAPEKFITKFAKIYTPVIIGCALLLGIILPLFNLANITESIRRALAFMIASCPCALVISIPLSYYASIGAASKKGLLVKGSSHINTAATADTIVFDKTGTITDGNLKITDIKTLGNLSKDEIMAYAKALEINSSHPIAQAICKYKTEKLYTATDVTEHFGKGIEGIVNNKKVVLGNNDLTSQYISDSVQGLILSIDSNAEAVIQLSDNIKLGTDTIFKEFYKNGIKNIQILSGDSQGKVDEVLAELPGACGKGNLLPHDKAKAIETLKETHKVIYVGDGINDAPALAIADFSIAVGNGSSLALETGDASLMADSLKPVLSFIKISKHTVSTVYFNIAFSLFIKLIVLILSVIGKAPIWLALLSDVGVLILAVLNSMSILYKKF